MLKKLKRPEIVYIVVPVVCLLFYLGILKVGHHHFDLTAHHNYFRHLADAFLHGRLYIVNPPGDWDLVAYHDKYYIYWPPAPALVYMPLVAIFGVNLPDVLISSFFGMINVWLIMKICSLLAKRFSLALTHKHFAWIGIFWGLGTVHFYMSLNGGVWFVSQILAQTFLFSSVYFLLAKKSKFGSLILSGLFFALTAYTRNHLVFSIFFIFFLYMAMHPKMKFKEWMIRGFVFILPFIICSLLNGWYNYARFGNVLENGLAYHLMNPYFVENFKAYGYFSLHYFPYNFFVEVIRPPVVMLHRPWIKSEPEGFGFIWGSPLFLLLIPAFFLSVKHMVQRKMGDRAARLIKTGSIAATIHIAFVIFTIMGTGWIQFCARYTLDFQFFLVVFLLFSWKDLLVIPYIKLVTAGLIIVSVGIEYIGAFVG
ncbi:MAG TPA: hypothetical protein VLJ68_11315 [Chitinophagaceae bacterium]|nr:hypothetical protein [Chitinophagaceae bacterium]